MIPFCAGTYVDALVPHLAKVPPVARKVVSEHEKDDATVGNWLRFTDREMAQLQRKAPSVRKDERRQEMLSRRLDDETDEDPGVIAVLRGPRLGMTAEDCRKVRSLSRSCGFPVCSRLCIGVRTSSVGEVTPFGDGAQRSWRRPRRC